MAPACAACRRPALLCLIFAAILLCFLCQDSSALLVCDQQALLDIRASQKTLPNVDWGDQTSGLPPPLASVPAYLLRSPVVISRRKRSRRRGKRAGVLVKLKILRRSTCWTDPRHPVRGSHVQPLCLRWIQPVVPPCPAAGCLHLPTEVPPPRCRVRNGGVDFRNLRPLRRVSTKAREEITYSLALLNARSPANKTFILNDFFTSRELDFMFLTETWIQVGVTPSTASVTQDVYQAEEHSNITLTWRFPVKTAVSVDSLYIDILYGEPLRTIYLYDTDFEAGLYQDELYRGRVQCDLELAKKGRIECVLTGLRLSDTGIYTFIIGVNSDSRTKTCDLSVTAASHQPVNETSRPASRGRIGLYVGSGLFTVVTTALVAWSFALC
ncbi:uncharacterized protein LOC144459869 [Epinephelus lanceolatus]